ncbi:MAG: DUF1294 domain-containing protein [Clostridium sp.]|nr:DUF1294 domain-containing protein [Clostridium sp.]MBQ5420791.1 DUF1294 domain-containing protein [Clostridium sp.]HAE80366.1 DUF1294 domain-containing protein [Lachnoclostridium sp.]
MREVVHSRLLVVFLLLNLVSFLLFGLDKWKAMHGRWRIPESTLLLSAALGGSTGAFLGMKMFHHKTRKAKFYLGVPALWIIQVILLWYLMHRL